MMIQYQTNHILNWTLDSVNYLGRKTLHILLKQNIKCFAMKLEDLGLNKDYPHVIRTRTAKPIAQRYYRMLPVMQREIEKQLHELLKHSIDKQVSDAPVQYRYDLKSCIRGVEVSRRIARDNIEWHQWVNKTYHDIYSQNTEYSINDLVWWDFRVDKFFDKCK